MKKKTGLIALIGLMLILLVTACGQQPTKQTQANEGADYPNKPVKIVAPSGTGGGWDTTARLMSKVMGETKLITVGLPVENVEGGSGKVFLEGFLKNNVGDPYTIFVNSPPMLINTAQGFKYSYKDVTPIAGIISEYDSFVVPVNSKYKTLKEVMDALKQNPASVKIGGGSAPGGMDHLAFMAAAKKAGIEITKINYVPFQGGGQVMTALLGNNIDLASTGISEIQGQMQAGKVRMLAVTASQRIEGLDVPTVKEAGYDATFDIWRGFFGAKDMPAYAKKYWEDNLAKMVKTPEWQQVVKNQKWTSSYRNSEEFTKFLGDQTQVIANLMKELGLSK